MNYVIYHKAIRALWFRVLPMDCTKLVSLLLLFSYLLVVVARTDPNDYAALVALKDNLENTPPNWLGTDPCGDGWVGIKCTNLRITSISLSSMNLTGRLSGDIGSLSQLDTLDLSYNKGLTGQLPQEIGNLKKLKYLILVGCHFTGLIPGTIGNLQQLVFLSLNSNAFSGGIPPSFGNLSKLYWLDIAENQLDGPIPVSNGTGPGLDMLHKTKHFHFGKNKLSGKIPPQLFSSKMTLLHVLFESNQLIDEIPFTLGLVKTLEVVRLDHNFLSGPVPKNLSNLTNVQDLFLSNNKLSGPLPDLAGMNQLSYLDMSINSFDSSDIPSWFSNLQSLTTLMMESTQLEGKIPVSLFSLPNLRTAVLKGNKLNGTLDVGTTSSNQPMLIDLQSNLIDSVKQEDRISDIKIILVDNPVCNETDGGQSYCNNETLQSNISYTTQPNDCSLVTCYPSQIPSPNCKCAYPYTGTLIFRAPTFSDFENKNYYVNLEKSLMLAFGNHQLPVDSVSLSNLTKDEDHYVKLRLDVFPLYEDRFTRTEIINIAFLFSNQTYQPPPEFGPFYFIGNYYENFAITDETSESSKSLNIGIIVGGVAGALVLLVLLVLAGIYAIHQKKKAKKALEQSNPFANWDAHDSNSSFPQLKGARRFSFEQLQKYTKNFSQASDIGSGGYGKVYRGTLPNGQLVAIKRAQKESKQGGLEFKTEIELLSRVHHKNIVGLVGFCFEKGEQMLIYEYVVNGTLKDALSGKSGIKLDWIRKLKVALGVARGLSYLHDLANPPIIHRDIKSANVLLDERLNAKVADFGLCKPMREGQRDPITTQVKGTMGYLDPEYYMTQSLTEKSDVYSFGVLMLELITARKPIERGKYIVKLVKNAMDRTKDLYGLHEILDPAICSEPTLKGFEKFVDLAMKCVKDSGTDRPLMSDVVKEIEDILLSAGSIPHAGSASNSPSIELSKGSSRHPYSNEFSDSSGPHSHSNSKN